MKSANHKGNQQHGSKSTNYSLQTGPLKLAFPERVNDGGKYENVSLKNRGRDFIGNRSEEIARR